MKNRLIELDILRGLSVLGMILVINPGNWSHQFSWLRHAAWQGVPVSDMIFPAFLFCVGVSIPLSFSKRIERGASYSQLFKKNLIRSILMISIGLFINAFPNFNWSGMRIPGVIQRIGLCYFLSANLYLLIRFSNTKSRVFWLFITVVGVLIGYLVLLLFIPIPGTPKVGNFYIWPALIDQKVFGIQHIWPYDTLEGQVSYDPDGLLASIPASMNVVLGIILGEIIKYHSKYYTVKYLCISAIILMLTGLLLSYTQVMVLVKKFWTSSFVLYSVGFSIIVLAGIKLILDTFKDSKKVFYPFIVFGSNALVAFVVSYMCMALMDKPLQSGTTFRRICFEFLQPFVADPNGASFLFSLIPLTVYFIGLSFMYKKRWLVKL